MEDQKRTIARLEELAVTRARQDQQERDRREQRLEQAGVSMNETTALINAIHIREEEAEHSGFLPQANATNIMLLLVVVMILVVGSRNKAQALHLLKTKAGVSAPKGEKDND